MVPLHSQNKSPLTMDSQNDLWRIISNDANHEAMGISVDRDGDGHSELTLNNPFLIHLMRAPPVRHCNVSPGSSTGAAISGLSPRGNVNIDRNVPGMSSLILNAPKRGRSSKFRRGVRSIPADPNPVYLIAPLEENSDDTVRCSDSGETTEGTMCTMKRVFTEGITSGDDSDSALDRGAVHLNIDPVATTDEYAMQSMLQIAGLLNAPSEFSDSVSIDKHCYMD